MSRRRWGAAQRGVWQGGEDWAGAKHTRHGEDDALWSRLVDSGCRDAEQDHDHIGDEDGYHPHARAFAGERAKRDEPHEKHRAR